MILLNEKEIQAEHFLDGTQRMTDVQMPANEDGDIKIKWHYQNDEELLTLYYLVNHMRDNGYAGRYILIMPYLPNARMDRVKSEKEVFTLKWFCKIINDMKFSRIYILDPHSNVSAALLDNAVIGSPAKFVAMALYSMAADGVDVKNMVLYYPDSGAQKKYAELFPDMPCCYGKKQRDWKTGKITGLSIENEMDSDLHGKTILMIDDIVSYGGTMYYGAEELKAMGAENIYAYVTHTEHSVLDKEKGKLLKSMENGTVKKLFTTDSIFMESNEHIEVFHVEG